jgi:uncharacterized NAD-dependent epimerase/dehydratase family protein
MLRKIKAVIYCERGFLSPLGKTAHGLIRHSQRYRIVGVIDSTAAGLDAGEVLDAKARGIPIFPSIASAAREAIPSPDLMVIGLAPTGFGAERTIVRAAKEALECGLSIHNGLHLFLSELPEIQETAAGRQLEVLDIRKPPSRRLRMFSGKILDINVPRLLVTGQDAAVGKRTAAIRLCKALEARGVRACLIGTGQTAWLQGVDYGIRLDALPLDFAGGEIEAEIIRAYKKEKPDIFIIEGQGSLLNPGYSCETMILLTACRPSMLVYVAAPGRSHYIDFMDFNIRSADEEMHLLEAVSGATVLGIVVHCDASGSLDVPSFRKGIPVAFGADGDLDHFADKIIDSL